jgi:hypothetical protein
MWGWRFGAGVDGAVAGTIGEGVCAGVSGAVGGAGGGGVDVGGMVGDGISARVDGTLIWMVPSMRRKIDQEQSGMEARDVCGDGDVNCHEKRYAPFL